MSDNPVRAFGSCFACLAALLLSACTLRLDESYFYRPIPAGTLTQEAVSRAAPAYAVSSHDIPTPDGATLHAVLLRQPGARGVVLYFGGNGYVMERYGAMTAAIFAPLQLDLMIVDHRGYGLSTGDPTAAIVESDGLAAFDHLARLRGVDRSRILVHGQSLGSFTAGHVAAHRPAAGAVLESSATTVEDWVGSRLRGARRSLVHVEIAEGLRRRGNLANVGAINEPLLLIVGAADRTTPPSLSRALYDASPLPPGRKALAVIPSAGHNDALFHAEAIAAYRRFLDAALPPRP